MIMDFLFKSRTTEIIRVFVFGALMLFLSSKVQFLWILFLVLLLAGLLTGQFTYINKNPVDRINFEKYQLSNFGFFILLLLVFGYKYIIYFQDKTLIEKIYWIVYIGTYLFNLKVVRK
jgi:hypothetical protein